MNNSSNEVVRVIDSTRDCPELSIITGKGDARAVLWPGNGAQWRTFNTIELQPGARTIDLQHKTDCVYYVEKGNGVVVDLASGQASAVGEGSMLHIDKGDRYRFEAGSDTLFLIGGPCPVDPSFYNHLAKAV